MAPVNYAQYPQPRPNLVQRAASSTVMGMTALVSKLFLNVFSRTEVIGLDNFVRVLQERENIDGKERERGLITVSNHMCIVDDPLIWGTLPWRIGFNPTSHRWSLGAHDICWSSRALGTFFGIGQVLPTHRSLHSSYGGAFQPTMTQAIRLLSSYPYDVAGKTADTLAKTDFPELRDPFTEGGLTFSTTPHDVHFAPSAFLSRRHAWVHVFPEGFVHQQKPQVSMRYFKWGVARMILESEPMPDLVPMFIDGTADVFPEDRGFPRAVPRPFQKITIAFGEKVDMEKTFGDLRSRWRQLVREDLEEQEKVVVREKKAAAQAAVKAREDAIRAEKERKWDAPTPAPTPKSESASTRLQRRPDVTKLGILSENLKYSKEAENIRIQVAKRVRDEVVKVRRSLGYPEEDPKFALAETWRRDDVVGGGTSGVDGSLEAPRT